MRLGTQTVVQELSRDQEYDVLTPRSDVARAEI